ncbi:MAG: calcium-translocating P-type ATPase, PMCA-type, partial [Clostridiales bacterium]|nr:calcium-translocating P-type ATPase, PMCA-type [Clostridiales bacterium]
MKEFTESKSNLIKKFETDVNSGLSDSSVESNRIKFGRNTFTKKKPESLLKRIWDAATEPMIIMLIAAGLIALGVNIFRSLTGGESNFLECIGVFAAIALSVIISVVMEGKSAKAFEALSDISSNTIVKAIRNNEIIMLNQAEIVAGDIVLLSAGDKVPADGRLIDSIDLTVDESALTGESISAKKNSNTIFIDDDIPLAERENMLYSGTYITSGNCKMLVTSVGDNTEFGKIAGELGNVKKESTPLQEKLTHLGKIITVLGVIAAAVVFISQIISFSLHNGLAFDEVLDAFITSIVLIVAAVPEGLPTIVAVSLSINIIKLSRQNALVKKMIASETVGCINVICSDKTGTLTENKMTVRAFYNNKYIENTSELSSDYLIHNICLNTTADISETGDFIGNPTECAMLNFYEQSEARRISGKTYHDERNEHDIVCSFPFSSELKHMTTISKVNGDVIAYVKGSPEHVLKMCRIDESERNKIEKYILKSEEKAMRVIAFAHKKLPEIKNFKDESNHCEMESNMVFDGFVAISDPLRKDVYDAVKSCKHAGISLKILTGDNIVTASSIANELHLLDNGGLAVEANEIENMSDDELSERLPKISVIARSTPTVKMRIVKLLKQSGNVVAVTGDGINDAPALKNADVGIAMGISGTEVSKEASDIVLLDDSFATIVKAVEWGRNIYENFKRFISFQLTVNLASVVVVFVSILLGLKAPFNALELLWINIIMDGPPALTLGLEPNYSNLMNRLPVKRNESIISKAMFGRISAAGIYMSVIFLCQYLFNFLNAADGEQHTVLFTLFVLFQLFNAFNCRELNSESIFKNFFKNKLMLLVVWCTFILQICIIQFGGAFFGTVPLGLTMWIKLFLLSLSIIILTELVKLVIRG